MHFCNVFWSIDTLPTGNNKPFGIKMINSNKKSPQEELWSYGGEGGMGGVEKKNEKSVFR